MSNPYEKDPFGHDFDKRFDAMWDRNEKIFTKADNMIAHPWRTMIIAGALWLLGFAIVIGIIAFFVSLFI